MSTHSHGDHDQAHDHGLEKHADLEQRAEPEKSECREALERLYVYLDGELTDDRRDAIRSHLDECSPCLEAFDFEAELKMVVARHCRDTVPEHLRLRVAAVLARASQDSQEPPSATGSTAV